MSCVELVNFNVIYSVNLELCVTDWLKTKFMSIWFDNANMKLLVNKWSAKDYFTHGIYTDIVPTCMMYLHVNILELYFFTPGNANILYNSI